MTVHLMSFLQFADENGTCREMEDVLNDMLSQRNAAESYLELLAVGSGIYLTGAELYVSDLCSQGFSVQLQLHDSKTGEMQ